MSLVVVPAFYLVSDRITSRLFKKPTRPVGDVGPGGLGHGPTLPA